MADVVINIQAKIDKAAKDIVRFTQGVGIAQQKLAVQQQVLTLANNNLANAQKKLTALSGQYTQAVQTGTVPQIVKLNNAMAQQQVVVQKAAIAQQRAQIAVQQVNNAIVNQQQNLVKAQGAWQANNAIVQKGQSFFSSINSTLLGMKNTLVAASAGIYVLKQAFSALASTAKVFFDLGQTGAIVSQTKASFDALTNSVLGSNTLLQDLRIAARGTIADLQLMESTLTIVAGTTGELQEQLLRTAPELLEIAKAANKLNPALGDTTYMFESITQGVKRQERRILDNLGIIVRLREANERYATAIGKTVEEMSAEEIQISFLNETLRVGQLLINQTGGSTESQADAYQRMAAEAENAKNTIAQGLNVALHDQIELLARATVMWVDYNRFVSEESQRLRISAQTYEEYAMSVSQAAAARGKDLELGFSWDNLYQKLITGATNFTEAEQKVIETWHIETRAIWDNLRAKMAWGDFQIGEIALRQSQANASTDVIAKLQEERKAILGLSLEELKHKELQSAVTKATIDFDTALKEAPEDVYRFAVQLREAEQALYDYEGGALAAARSQAILNSQLAGARAGFGGQFAGLVDGYTAKIAALNDQLAKAGGGGGGGKPEKPVDMEEARLREAVAAGDLRDAYGDLNEIEGKITEQEKTLAEARESGADPAWIEYLEGSIQHLKDEQARAKLAIYEKQKALTELQNILNGVAEAEDNYAASSGGAASAAINLKDEIAKLNEELDKEIKNMIVMAAVNEIMNSGMEGAGKVALDMGVAFGLIDEASAKAIEAATLVGKGVGLGAIDPETGVEILDDVWGALDELKPQIEIVKGQIVSIAPDEKTKAEMLARLDAIVEDAKSRFGEMGTSAETTAGQIGAIAAVLSETAGDKGVFARYNIDTKKTLPEAVKDSITALEELDLAFLNSHKENSGLYGFRLAIKDLIDKLAEMISKIQIAKGELGIGGTTNTGTNGESGGASELATGGPVYRNRPYLVGERGPEMFMPSSNGQIIPNHQLVSGSRKRGRGNGGINVSGSLTINLQGVRDADALLESLRDALGVA